MTLTALSIFRVDPMATASSQAEPIVLASATDLSDVSLFFRTKARNVLTCLAGIVAGRVTPCARTHVAEQGHAFFCQSMAGGRLVVVAVADKEYNMRVAFDLVALVGARFIESFRGKWEVAAAHEMAAALSWPELDAILKEWRHQDKCPDKVSAIQRDIDDTKTVMLDAIDKALKKGEDLDQLVLRSKDLDDASKDLYVSSKKMNSWCACVIA